MRWKDFQVVRRRRADGNHCRETQKEWQYEKRRDTKSEGDRAVTELVFQANPNRKCMRGIKKKAI